MIMCFCVYFIVYSSYSNLYMNFSVVYPCSGVSHCVAMWLEWQCYQTLEMKYLVQLIANSTLIERTPPPGGVSYLP